MTIALFGFAINHILRICRILKMARGNAMLIGLGGSGRSTLTKIASLVCDYELFGIDITK